jgi:phage terminase large subunit-like protein
VGRGATAADVGALKGFPCFAALDLANTSDFAALALLFPLTADLEPAADLDRPALWFYRWRLWIPEETANPIGAKLREIAAPWIADGWVRATEGDCIDPHAIEADVIAAASVRRARAGVRPVQRGDGRGRSATGGDPGSQFQQR